MHLGRALVSLALATCASAALAAIPTDGDSMVVERPSNLRRNELELSQKSEVFTRTYHELDSNWHELVGVAAAPDSRDMRIITTRDGQEEIIDVDEMNMLIRGHFAWESHCSHWHLRDYHCCAENDFMALCGRPRESTESNPGGGQILEFTVINGEALELREQWVKHERACLELHAVYKEECSHMMPFNFEYIPWYSDVYQCLGHALGISKHKPFGMKQTAVECVRKALDWPAQDRLAVLDEAQGDVQGDIAGEQEHQAIHNEVRAITIQKTVTASPFGTTTVYEPGMLSTITKDFPGTEQPQNLALAQTGSIPIALTTMIEHTTIVTTVNLDNPEPTTTYATLTDPINPDITSYVTDPSSSCETNTSIDTKSYVDISTFTASGLSIRASSTPSLAKSPAKPTLTNAIGGGTILASKTGAFSSLITDSSATMPSLPGPSKPMSTTMTMGSLAHAVYAWDGSGANVVVMMLAGMGACLVLALFL